MYIVQNQHTDVSVVQKCQMGTSLEQDKESKKAVKWTKNRWDVQALSFTIKKTREYLATCNQLRCRGQSKQKCCMLLKIPGN